MNEENESLSVSSTISEIEKRRASGERALHRNQRIREENDYSDVKQDNMRHDIQNFQRNRPRRTGGRRRSSAATNKNKQSGPLERSTEIIKRASQIAGRKEEGDVPGAYQMEGRALGSIPVWRNRNLQGRVLCSDRSRPTSSRVAVHESGGDNTNNLSQLDSLQEHEIMTADVEALPVDKEEEDGTKISPKKCTIIFVIISVITILGIGLGVGFSNMKNTDIHQKEIMSCDHAEIAEIGDLPIAWKSCLCNNNRKVDVPENHLSKYKTLKEKFIKKSILPVDFDKYVQDCDLRKIALLWIAEDVIENNKEREEASLIRRFALALLYLSTSNNHPSQWTNNTNWMTSETECNWAGIWCNKTYGDEGESFSISLYENDLVGTIPPEISLLAEVVMGIEISRNQIFGSLPSEIGLLTKLTYFTAWQNSITGSVPTEIGLLTKLISFAFSANIISGVIPTEIGLLIELKGLRVGDNSISGTIPTEIGRLNFLEALYLESNELKGAIPSEIGNLESLSTFWSRYNKLTGTIPSNIGLCASLERLYINDNEISGAIPKEMGQLQNVTVLNFATNRLTEIPSTIGLCTSLEHISISNNKIGGTIPAELGSLYNLERLHLSSNNLIGTIPTELGNCRNLIDIYVEHNSRLEGTMPSEFGKLSRLEKLGLCNTRLIGNVPEQICSLQNDTQHVAIFWENPNYFKCHEDSC